MAFNGSGVHNRVHDWTQDLTNTIPVTASRMDAEHDDISTALSTTICRDGQSTTTARIPFAAGLSAAAGTTASVAYAQTNDSNTGLYFPATDQWGLAAGGIATITSTATKVTMPVAVDFTGVAAPTSNDGAALGSTSQKWSDLFLANGAVINFNSGDILINHAGANTLRFQGGNGGGFTFDTTIYPESNDAAALGDGTLKWSDLFLASGAVINFNNGDVTVTHSADTLTVAGGTLAAAALTATSLTVGGNTVSGTVPTRQVLTSGTGATYTRPAGCRQLKIRMVGGGGGAAAASTNNGSAGTATVFNSIEAAPGGGGSNSGNKLGGTGGTGGAGSASFRIAGSDGATGDNVAAASGGGLGGGHGGASAFGGAGRAGGQNGAGQAGKANSGGGGGGGATAAVSGGGGGGAGEFVELIINSPSATYTYTVGAGGAGGAAGTNAGGDGGSGIIIVDEFY